MNVADFSPAPFVTIVIPFYQRESGILGRALRSILDQVGAPEFEIIVVDDESPLSAASEVSASELAGDSRIRVVSQRNGGPGAARNTGLDNASARSTHVAFLDSDDRWAADHLQKGLAALDAGFDVYFANHIELGASIDAFTLRAGRGFDATAHPALAGVPGARRFEGDMFGQILSMNIIETSTVVYRREPVAGVRFNPDYRYAFEDYLFWIELARATPRFAFSTHPAAFYGRGINIFKSAGFGSDGAARRTAESARFFAHVRDNFALSKAQRARISKVHAQLRKDAAADLLHRLRHRKPVDWQSIRSQFRNDALCAVTLPVHCAVIAMRSLLRRRENASAS